MTATQNLYCFIINTLTGVNLCVTIYKLLGTGSAGIYALLTSEENAVLTVTASSDLSSAVLLTQRVHSNMDFLEPSRHGGHGADSPTAPLVAPAPCFVPVPPKPR